MSFKDFEVEAENVMGRSVVTDDMKRCGPMERLHQLDSFSIDELLNDAGKKKRKKPKSKKKAKAREERLEEMVARVSYRNGVLEQQNYCLESMMRLALAASNGTLREPPIEVGFKVLNHGRR